jgi:hypothetical protein
VLPDVTLQAIFNEIDTQQRQQALMAVLEQAISFVGALGGGTVAGSEGGDGGGVAAEQSLREYATSALMLTEEAWREASTPTLEQHVCLCHLQAIFMGLEEGSDGGVEGVHSRYREALPAEVAAVLMGGGMARLQVGELLGALHDLLVFQLTEGTWPADASLYQYLTFSAIELEEAEWFVQHFPRELELRHALALYKLLQGRQG